GGERPGFFATLPSRSTLSLPGPDERETASESELRFLAGYDEYARHRRRRHGIALFIVAVMALMVFQYWKQIRTEANLIVERNTNAVQAGVFSILGSKPSLDLGARAAVAGAELQENNPDVAVFNFRTLLS